MAPFEFGILSCSRLADQVVVKTTLCGADRNRNVPDERRMRKRRPIRIAGAAS